MILMEITINKKKFCLVINSIVDERVDAIINPANEQLRHGGGVAGLISRSGGPEIQRESFQKAPIPTGQSVHTTAGTLPFKYIIHTVGPIWKGGGGNEAEKLASAVRSSLQLAAQLGLESVSMPSISTGIFGYPLEPAIRIIKRTIFDFMKLESPITLINLCEFSEEKAEQIKKIFAQED